MRQPDTDWRPHVFKTSRALASAIVLSLIFSFIMPTGVVFAADCTTAICVEAKTTVSNPIVNSSIPLSFTFSNSGTPISQAIIDIEIYDANNTRIYQYFVEQQYLPTTSAKALSTSFTPKSAGVYTVKVGVFGSGWSQLYYWTDTAGSITVADATPSVPELPVAVNVWWPTNNASLTGVQPFKSVLEGKNIEEYTMFWQIDAGQLNKMETSYTDGPHKESWVDVSGWNWRGNGPYTVTFIAKNKKNLTLAKKSVVVYIQEQPTTILLPIVAAAVNQVLPDSNKPFSQQTLYVQPSSPAKTQAEAWRTSRPDDAARMDKIAAQSQAQWFGNWNSNVFTDVQRTVTQAKNVGQIPVLVAYNIPLRDCGSWSGGGSGTEEGYKTWIQSFASAITYEKVIVILEPDALAHMDCLSNEDKQRRYSLLSYAVDTLKAKSNTVVYIDAGHAFWIDSTTMSSRLKNSGIDKADGFSLNVSNFIRTEDNITYGERLSTLVNNKHFVIDTSRNGFGPSGGEWCNPNGRALGQTPTVSHTNALVDALLWIKTPGESDGSCNGGPSAGQWWGEYALGLALRAGW